MTTLNNDVIFSSIATRYDFLNHLLSLNIGQTWRKELVRCAEVSAKDARLPSVGQGSAFGRKPGERILDVCTGTGDVAISFAAMDGLDEVIGIDLSDEMLHIARKKTKKAGFNMKIKLLKANALNLPFEDNSFDVACIGFGLRNLSDRKMGIAEMVRILKDGGRLLILEFSPPRNSLLGVCYSLWLNTIIPTVGGIISNSASSYRYLSRSIANFLKPDEIMQLLKEEKLKNLQFKSLSGGIAYIFRGEKG